MHKLLRLAYVMVIALVAGAIWLGATPAFAAWIYTTATPETALLPLNLYSSADAIVVLGGGYVPLSSEDWTRSEQLARKTRIGVGLNLWKQGSARLILVTGGHGEAARMEARLSEQGIPASSVLSENASMTTRENALRSVAILRPNNLHKILLVTSALHMKRAEGAFQRLGVAVVPVPVPLSDPAARSCSSSCWKPSMTALRLSFRCAHELAARVVYQLLQWS